MKPAVNVNEHNVNEYKFATYFAQQTIRSVIFTNKFINSFA